VQGVSVCIDCAACCGMLSIFLSFFIFFCAFCSWHWLFHVKFCSKGSKSGASSKCAGCQGSGMKVSIRHLGPSMIQQMQHPCNECKGTGETINDKDRCPQCKGEKVAQEKKVLEVVVEKGMQNGQRITFPGEADEAVSRTTLEWALLLFLINILYYPARVRAFSLFCVLCAAWHCYRGHRLRPPAKGSP